MCVIASFQAMTVINDYDKEKYTAIHILGPITLAGLATHALYHAIFIFWPGADAGSDRKHH